MKSFYFYLPRTITLTILFLSFYAADSFAVSAEKRWETVNQTLDAVERNYPSSNSEQQQYYRSPGRDMPPALRQILARPNRAQIDTAKSEQPQITTSDDDVEWKNSSSEEGDVSTRWSVGVGRRVDQLDWSLAGDINGANPNVSFEEAWRDVNILQLQTKGQIEFKPIVLDAKVAYGRVTKGSNRESEYLTDNRGNEFLRSDNSADDGNTKDFSLGAGIRLHYDCDMDLDEDSFAPDVASITTTFLGGYSYHEQNLVMQDGVQTIDTNNFYGLGPFNGLDSTYETQWRGPWVGVEMTGKYAKLFGLLRFEYHWADYKALGDFNLRNDLQHPSFEHNADGIGYVVSAGLGWDIHPDWMVNLDAEFQKWETDPGTEDLSFLNGTVTSTQLNEVNWESYALMLSTTYHFN